MQGEKRWYSSNLHVLINACFTTVYKVTYISEVGPHFGEFLGTPSIVAITWSKEGLAHNWQKVLSRSSLVSTQTKCHDFSFATRQSFRSKHTGQTPSWKWKNIICCSRLSYNLLTDLFVGAVLRIHPWRFQLHQDLFPNTVSNSFFILLPKPVSMTSLSRSRSLCFELIYLSSKGFIVSYRGKDKSSPRTRSSWASWFQVLYPPRPPASFIEPFFSFGLGTLFLMAWLKNFS